MNPCISDMANDMKLEDTRQPNIVETSPGACDPCGEECMDPTFHPWPNTAGCDTSQCCLCQGHEDDSCELCEKRI